MNNEVKSESRIRFNLHEAENALKNAHDKVIIQALECYIDKLKSDLEDVKTKN